MDTKKLYLLTDRLSSIYMCLTCMPIKVFYIFFNIKHPLNNVCEEFEIFMRTVAEEGQTFESLCNHLQSALESREANCILIVQSYG